MVRITAAEAKKQLSRLLSQVGESHEPVHITGKDNGAVLICEEDWRSIQETLYLQSIPGMSESIVQGLKTPAEECSEKLDW